MHGSPVAGSANDFWVGPATAPDTYRLVSLIGGGGEGEVWHGVLPLSTGGRHQVAVKVMRTTAAGHVAWDRFGHLLTSLSHPGLVRVTDVFSGPAMHRAGQARPGPECRYVVMDHVPGPTLRDWCDENPDATAAQRLRMLRTVAAALDEMHSGSSTEVAVAHGDVKPANIVVSPDGATVLVDLGLVQLADAAGPSGHSAPYAAPELRMPGALPTPASDAYAFAVTTAQVLLGHPPPTGPGGFLDPDALRHALGSSPVTARRPMLVQRIMATLSAPPEARPTRLGLWLDSAAETLSQVTAGGSPVAGVAVTDTSAWTSPAAPVPARRRRRRAPLIIAGLVVLALVAGGAVVFSGVLSPASAAGGPGSQAAAVTTTPAAPTSDPVTTTTDPTTTEAAPTTTESSASGLDPGETAYLSQLDRVDYDRAAVYGQATSGTYSAGGQQFGRSVLVRSSCANKDGGNFWVEYDLSQDWSRFTASVGLSDDSAADSAVTYTITGDKRELASGPLTLAQLDRLDLNVKGVLRLRLSINDPRTIRAGCSNNDASPSVVFGDAALVP